MIALLFTLSTTPSFATTWGQRLDLGVAAVDRASGEVRWEAWRMDELPASASDDLKAAAKKLLSANKENFDYDKAPGQMGMPAPLTMTQFVRYEFADTKHQFVLMRGSPRFPGAEIARFARKEYPGWPIVSTGGTLYFLLGGRVYAMKPWGKADPPDDGKWGPAWIYDLRTDLKFEEKDRARQYYIGASIDGGKFWVVHPRGMLRLDSRGRREVAFDFKQPWEMIWDGFGTPVTFGEKAIYYRHGKGVMAIDKKTGAEKWRLLTTRNPYPSLVEEVDNDLVLVQIGSNVRPTIAAAVFPLKDAIPTVLKETNVTRQVAATKLIHAYGDGYLRPKLAELAKKWRADEIDALLKDWPVRRNRRRLIEATVNALVDQKTPDRLFHWATLQGLIYQDPPDAYVYRAEHYSYDRWNDQPLGLSAAMKTRLVRHCEQVLATGEYNEKAFAASVLVSREVGWNGLSVAKRKQLFTSKHRAVWRWAAFAMLKNGHRQTLLDWAPLRSADEQIDVLYVLNQRPSKTLSGDELDLWVACAKHTPGPVAYAMYFAVQLPGFKTPASLRRPIREYLEKEIAKPTVRHHSQAEYDLSAALYVMHKWGDPGDTPLLFKYLKHPNRNEVYVGGFNSKEWVYTIRNKAKQHLEERGVKIPANVVEMKPKVD